MAKKDSKPRDRDDIETDAIKHYERLLTIGAMIQRLSEDGNDECFDQVNFALLGKMLCEDTRGLKDAFYTLWESSRPITECEAANG